MTSTVLSLVKGFNVVRLQAQMYLTKMCFMGKQGQTFSNGVKEDTNLVELIVGSEKPI